MHLIDLCINDLHHVAGTLLREKLVHNTNTGSHWTSSLLFSLVQELVPHFDITSQTFDGQHIVFR